jgi:hypothetical protein
MPARTASTRRDGAGHLLVGENYDSPFRQVSPDLLRKGGTFMGRGCTTAPGVDSPGDPARRRHNRSRTASR